MTNRFIWFWVAAGTGILLLLGGCLAPVHIRAIDASVLRAAGRGTATLFQTALSFSNAQKPGPAKLLIQIVEARKMADQSAITKINTDLAKTPQAIELWGGPQPRWADGHNPGKSGGKTELFTDYVVRKENRDRLLEYLANTRHPAAADLLKCRGLTNTVIFPPSWTSSGQAFDAAIAICGLLMVDDQMQHSLNGAIRKMVAASLAGESPHELEQALLDLMSLGQRLNWHQLSALTRGIQDARTLHHFVNLVRRSEPDLPTLYAGCLLSGDVGGVIRYAMNFADTGIQDLKNGMHHGAGGLRLLIGQSKRLRQSPADRLLTSYAPFDYLPRMAWKAPGTTMALKWLLYFASGYCFALAAHFLVQKRSRRFDVYTSDTKSLHRDTGTPGRPFALPPVRGIHVAREILFALGFLAVVLLATEPFLTHDTQKLDFPIRLRLPIAEGLVASAPQTATHTSFMNRLSLLTLLLFFVLQALIYTACMFKLAEIRRQKVGPRMKLKLLDNEDHLFDAGLYLGFVGTIISLILVSLGVIKPSLMAAYSSTSFGIIFVSAFKIFNLRPLRRQLLLEAEAVSPESAFPASSRPQPTP